MSHAYPQRVDRFVDRYTDRQSVVAAGGQFQLAFRPFPVGLTYLHGAFFATTDTGGAFATYLYLDSIAPENYVGGSASQIGAGIFSVVDDWFAEGGQRLIALVSGVGAGITFGMSLYGTLVDSSVILQTPRPAGSGFGQPDDGTDGPAQDSPDATTLHARDPLGAGRPAAVSRWEPIPPGPADGADWPLGPTPATASDPGY